MSTYTERVGQVIGAWTVEADSGRTKRGEVIWRLRNRDGRIKHLKTHRVIQLAKEHGVPAPGADR